MSKISVLGLGAMGSRMASNLLKAGHSVTVWNTRPDAAATLVVAGATKATTPREAATNADFVISMVRDNEASREVRLSGDDGALVDRFAKERRRRCCRRNKGNLRHRRLESSSKLSVKQCARRKFRGAVSN